MRAQRARSPEAERAVERVTSYAYGTFVDPPPHWGWTALRWAAVPFVAVGAALLYSIVGTMAVHIVAALPYIILEAMGADTLILSLGVIVINFVGAVTAAGFVAQGTRFAPGYKQAVATALTVAVALLSLLFISYVPEQDWYKWLFAVVPIGTAAFLAYRVEDLTG